jgi:hypothetical protein
VWFRSCLKVILFFAGTVVVARPVSSCAVATTGFASSGSTVSTGVSSEILPCSTSCRAAIWLELQSPRYTTQRTRWTHSRDQFRLAEQREHRILVNGWACGIVHERRSRCLHIDRAIHGRHAQKHRRGRFARDRVGLRMR